MPAVMLAALSALVWGVADFSGGKASQRAAPLAVSVFSQALGLPVLALALILVPGAAGAGDLAWGAGAGLAGFAGVVLLYRALASGAMAVVAPVTAVTAALVPIVVGLLTERPPGALALAGAVLAVVAIALVSLGPAGGRRRVTPRLVGLATVAGVLFGLFFVLIAQTSPEAGMWPLVSARLSSVVVGAVLMAGARVAARPVVRVLSWTVAAGVLDISANAFYLAAATRGHLSIVAPVAALYPASTVLLALAVDRERLRPVQVAGLGLAAAALVLTST